VLTPGTALHIVGTEITESTAIDGIGKDGDIFL
jgi:hypothetical protein